MAEPHQFRTTHWTQVVAARGESPEARLALRSLCEVYYEPVSLFIRRSRGNSSHAAESARDLTQAFFAQLLEGHGLAQADRTRGRFRSYLLGAVKHFLADQYDRERALKRGGGEVVHSLSNSDSDNEFLASDFEPVDPHGFPPDEYFDRQWGLLVVQQAIATLRAEAKRASDVARFEALQPWLVTPVGHGTAFAAAQAIHLSEGAFKVAVHRLRKRFRQVVVDQIAATVDDPNDVPDELNSLIAAVSQGESQEPSKT